MKPYFATLSQEQITNELYTRIEDYLEYCHTSGRLSRWRASYKAYYGYSRAGDNNTWTIGQAGEQGEVSVLKVNHIHNLVSHQASLITSSKPAIQARASNTDATSQADCLLAQGLIEYYLREKKLAALLSNAVKLALILDEAFVSQVWEVQSGEVYGQTDSGAVIHEGDLAYSLLTPIDVVRDYRKKSFNKNNWIIVREMKNRFDLIAQFPELESKIMAAGSERSEYKLNTTLVNHNANDTSEDDIPVWTFYHRACPSLLQGRELQFLENNTVLSDGPLPYKDLPVHRISVEDQFETSQGFTYTYDLLSIQQAIDVLYSTVFSNQKNFGLQNIMAPKGSGVDVQPLTSGANLIEYDPKLGPPQPLNLVQTPAEIFNFIKTLESVEETLSNMNSTVRGNPEASLKSGAALALVASQAIQASSNLQQSYYELLESVGSSMIKILQDFATVPRVAYIVGEAGRAYLQEFKGSDLSKVSRVIVEPVNPLSQTQAGRLQMAQDLLQAGNVSPETYIQVATTGRLEPVYMNTQTKRMLIKRENELLSKGKNPPVTAIDPHADHILEHACVIDSPEARSNPAIVQATLAHIQEHINALKTVDPTLLQLLKQQPLQGGTPGDMSQMGNPQNPIQQQAQDVNQPNMPSLPQGAPQEAEQAYDQMQANTQG